MFKNIYPLFERKRLLKKEMLENLRDYPRDIFQILYQNYSDGILAGCDIKVSGDRLTITPGIIYHKSIPYILNQNCKIPYSPTGELAYLKIKCFENVLGVEQQEYLSQLYLDGVMPDTRCEMELARFKLQEGARLRNEYTSFFDYDTEFDTVNRIHVPYAAPDRSSISPEILKTFARTVLQSAAQNLLDYSFCIHCIQCQSAVAYEVIENYLNIRTKNGKRDYSNDEIYGALKSILTESSSIGNHGTMNRRDERKLLLL